LVLIDLKKITLPTKNKIDNQYWTDSEYSKLLKILNIQNISKEKMITAFTHKSATNNDTLSYERLEFIGDRVLNLIAAEIAIKEKKVEIIDIQKKYTELVNNKSLTNIMVNVLKIQNYILFENIQKPLSETKILSDVFEAIVGLIHLELGILAAKTFVREKLLQKTILNNSLKC